MQTILVFGACVFFIYARNLDESINVCFASGVNDTVWPKLKLRGWGILMNTIVILVTLKRVKLEIHQ